MLKKSLISFIFVGLLVGCTRPSTQNEGMGGSNTGKGTPDQTGTGYTVDSTAGKKDEKAADNPSEADRKRADQTQKNSSSATEETR